MYARGPAREEEPIAPIAVSLLTEQQAETPAPTLRPPEIVLPEVQVPKPEVTILFDVDPPQAAATRRRVFDMVATEKTHIAGMHLHFPATAHLGREGDGYRLFPEAWEQTL
jgi:hypothetical protein